MLGWLRTFLCCAATVSAAPLHSEPVTLTPGQMRQAAGVYLQIGQPEAAKELAEALMARDPNDAVAKIILIEALSALGDHVRAASLAAELFRSTDDPDVRFIAARSAAREHAALDQGTRAQVWLRRARQFAPNPASAAEVAQDYGFVRSRNPLQVQLDFGISPSSNINNGSAQTIQKILYFGVPIDLFLTGDARALSGLSVSTNLELSYALTKRPDAATFVTFNTGATSYILSRQAQAQAPDVRGRDFSYLSTDVGLRHIATTGGGGKQGYSLALGRIWSGGNPLYNSVGLSADRSFPLGEDQTISVNGHIERQFNLRNLPQRDSLQVTVRDALELGTGDRVSFSASFLRGFSDDAGYDYVGYAVGALYAFGDPILGGKLSLSADIGQRNYALGPLDPVRRVDRFAKLSADFTFENVEYYGFSPAIVLNDQINQSNSGRYDTRGVNIGLDMRSSF